MQKSSKRVALTMRLPKRSPSGRSFKVACILGPTLSINDFEVDLLDAILREHSVEGVHPAVASNDNSLMLDEATDGGRASPNIGEAAMW